MNNLVDPIIHNHPHVMQAVLDVMQAVVLMEVDHAQPRDNSFTLIVSSDPSGSQESGGSVNGALAAPPNGFVPHNVQVGMVFLPNSQPDPVLGSLSMEGLSAWNCFFKPQPDITPDAIVSTLLIGWIFSLLSCSHLMILPEPSHLCSPRCGASPRGILM
jgi:hypothetical protein